jgi:hypothetical protein
MILSNHNLIKIDDKAVLSSINNAPKETQTALLFRVNHIFEYSKANKTVPKYCKRFLQRLVKIYGR